MNKKPEQQYYKGYEDGFRNGHLDAMSFLLRKKNANELRDRIIRFSPKPVNDSILL